MTDRDWEKFQQLALHVQDLGLLVDLSRSGLPEDALTHDPLVPGAFPGAFRSMRELESGAIANPDENRRVGHYWLRAPALSPDEATRTAVQDTVKRIHSFAADIHACRIAPAHSPQFRNLLVIGIGGSALGPQFVADALTSSDDRMRPFFFDNSDSDGMARELTRIAAAGGLGETLTLVVSKSGGTKETRNGMREAAAAYAAFGLEFSRHAVAITGEGSELDDVAVAEGWLARFPMWDWIGGRTSELSAVGLLPAALQGIDIDAMLEGAADCDVATRVEDVANNPAAMLALAWFRLTDGRGARDMVVLPYKDRLLLFSRYLQQLVMESLGKEKDLQGKVVHQGIAVYGNKGSTDQHAYVQQLRDGVANFFVTFVEVAKDRSDDALSLAVEDDVTSGDYLLGFLLGTRRALFESGRPSITLTIPDVSARSIGILIALYERTVGLYASLVNINAYHQPGVEAGKKAAAAVLAIQKTLLLDLRAHKGSFRGPEEMANAIGENEEAVTVFKLLEHLAANPDHGVSKKPGSTAFTGTYGVA